MSDPWPPRPPEPPAEADGSVGARRSVDRRALGLAIAVVLVFIAIAALASGTTPPGGPTFPPVGATTGTVGSAVAVTRGEVVRALGGQGLQVEDATRPYRPAEAPAFATAPRIVLRAILPADPDHGLVVIYEFADPAAASSAAQEQAAYIASGVGRVQFANDARFALRVVGSTAVFFAWSPAGSPDERTAAIETALETLGLEVAIPG